MSPGVVVPLVIVTVVLVLLLAWELGRPAGRFRAVMRRLFVLGVCLMTALSFMAVANSNMGWVKTTSDLVGLVNTPPVPTTVTVDPGAASTTPVTPTGDLPADVAAHPGDARWETTFAHDPSDSTWHAMVSGVASGLDRSVTVWTPADYSPTSATVYDVVVFIHGYPGSDSGVVKSLGVNGTISSLMAQGKIPPTIFVVADLSMGGAAPNCVDVHEQPKVETFLTKDLVSSIRTNFPNVSGMRSGWVLAGISAGGYCAPVLYMRHRDQFSAAIGMSGYDAPELGALSRASAAVRSEFTISSMVRASGTSALHMYLTATTNDSDALRWVDAVLTKQRTSDRIRAVVDSTGGHGWRTWARQFPAALQWWAGGAMASGLVEGATTPRATTPSGGGTASPTAAATSGTSGTVTTQESGGRPAATAAQSGSSRTNALASGPWVPTSAAATANPLPSVPSRSLGRATPASSPLAMDGWLTAWLLVVSSIVLVLVLPRLAGLTPGAASDSGSRARRRRTSARGQHVGATTATGEVAESTVAVRSGGRGILGYVLRVLMVTFTCLWVFVTVLILVNIPEGFFSDWTDLALNWRMFF